jgi:hypothetical protein
MSSSIYTGIPHTIRPNEIGAGDQAVLIRSPQQLGFRSMHRKRSCSNIYRTHQQIEPSFGRMSWLAGAVCSAFYDLYMAPTQFMIGCVETTKCIKDGKIVGGVQERVRELRMLGIDLPLKKAMW